MSIIVGELVDIHAQGDVKGIVNGTAKIPVTMAVTQLVQEQTQDIVLVSKLAVLITLIIATGVAVIVVAVVKEVVVAVVKEVVAGLVVSQPLAIQIIQVIKHRIHTHG